MYIGCLVCIRAYTKKVERKVCLDLKLGSIQLLGSWAAISQVSYNL